MNSKRKKKLFEKSKKNCPIVQLTGSEMGTEGIGQPPIP